jgi:hypothetical protein
MTSPLIFLAVAALAIVSYLAGRSAQMRSNAATDAKLRGEITLMAKAIAEAIETK